MLYLPLQATNRSQRVRIGGKTILPNVTSYIDLGTLSPVAIPTFTYSKVGTKAAGKGLKASVYFLYGVTAVDSNGTETPIAVGVAKTEAGAETESNLNFVKVTFTPVEHAVSYNVYRAGVGKTGYASQALAEAAIGSLKVIANVKNYSSTATGLTATYQDTNSLAAEEGTTAPTGGFVNQTNYNSSKTAWSTRHELANHQAVGAVIVTGAVTPNPNDWVPTGTEWKIVLESEKVKFEAMANLLQRSTGIVRSVAEAAVAKSAEKCASGKERYTIFVYNTQTNLVESVQGAEEAEKTTLTNSTVIASTELVEAKLTKYQQKLLVVRTTETVTTPEIMLGRQNLTRVIV